MKQAVSGFVRRWSAHAVVMALLLATACAVHVGRALHGVLMPRFRARPAGRRRVLLVGTFYNENWLRSHADPLCAAESIGRVYVVTDRPLFAHDKIEYVCPPRWLSRVAGRMAARTWAVVFTALRHRPDVLMGYHIMPNGLLCLVAAALTGARTVYQMTGGPVQIIGGGHGSENVLLRRLGRPSRVREALMFHLVRQFDWVATRGRKAVEFIEANRLGERCLIIPGSVDCSRFAPTGGDRRRYDLVSVGRLVACKRFDRLIDILAEMKAIRPDVSAAIVGDGPLAEALRARAAERGVSDNLHLLGRHDDVPAILGDCRLFVLTSESEGLSIAMVEAMAAGLPAVVPDVGDLGDVVRDGETGLLIDPSRPAEAAQRIATLLADNERVERLSRAARDEILNYNAVAVVTRRWEEAFAELDGGADARPAAATKRPELIASRE